MATEQSKRCTRCGETKPVSVFSKQARGKYGVGSRCRECRSLDAKERPVNREAARAALARYRERHRDRIRARQRELRRANPEKQRKMQRRYRDKDRAAYNLRAKERQAKYRAENPAAERAACARWVKAHPDRHRVRQQRWDEQHRERMRPVRAARQAAKRAANREAERAKVAEWRSRSRDKTQAYREGRRARKTNAPGNGVTPQQWSDVRTAALGICAYCNERKPLTMDHIVPLLRGGAHDVDNVAAVCGSCNQSKGTKSLLHWLARRALDRAA